MRLYNGCPDDELQSVWDSQDKAKRSLKKADNKAWCTYFPLEHKYSCARWLPDGSFQSLTGLHPTVESACEAAVFKIGTYHA